MPSASYTSEPKSLDNVTGNEGADVSGYVDAEFAHTTLLLQAERWGCAVRDPGLPHSIEMIVFNADAGQWAVIPIEPLRALSIAEDLIKMASRRL